MTGVTGTRNFSAASAITGAAKWIVARNILNPATFDIFDYSHPTQLVISHGMARVEVQFTCAVEGMGLVPGATIDANPVRVDVTVYGYLGGSGSDFAEFPLPKPAPGGDPETLELDLAGSFSVTYPVNQEVVEAGGGYAGYGGRAVADMPMYTTIRLQERIQNGASVVTQATICGVTVTVTETAPTGATAASYELSHALEAISGATSAVGGSVAGSGTINGAPLSCPGSVSGSAGSATAGSGMAIVVNAGGHSVGGGSTIYAQKKLNLDCRVYAEKDSYPGSVGMRIDRKLGDMNKLVTATGGSYSDSITQETYLAQGTLDGGTPTVLASKSEWSPVRLWVDGTWLADNREDTDAWRVLMLGKAFTALSLVQADTHTIDDCASLTPAGDYAGAWVNVANTTLSIDAGKIKAVVSGGTGSFKRTFTPARGGLGGYRYLTLKGQSDAAGSPFGVKIGVKEWTTDYQGTSLTWGAGLQEYLIDLCCPTNATATTDPFDTRWPMPTNDNSLAGPGAYWGCQCPAEIQITGLSDTVTYWIDTVGMKRNGDSLAEWQPAFKWEAVDADDSYRRRFWLGRTDGKSSAEETDTYISPDGLHEPRNIGEFVDDINAVDVGGTPTGVRHPGWAATIAAAIDTPDVDGGDWEYGYLNRQRPSTWLFGGGACYADLGAGAGWQNGIDIDYSAGANVPAQMLFDWLEWYPGCDDVFGLGPASPAAGTLYIKARKVFRNRAWGLLISDVTGLPLSGGRVEMTEVGTGADAGRGASDSRGLYTTGSPYGHGDRVHDIRCLESGGGVIEELLRARKSYRACFRVHPESDEHWISYDINEAMRHARAFLRNETIWTGFASNREATIWSDTDSGISGTAPCLRYDRWHAEQPVWVAYVTPGTTIVAMHSEDEGGSWTSMGTITTSGKWPALVLTRDGRHCYYWWDGSAIYGKMLDAFGGTIIPQFTAIAADVDDDAIAADEYTIGAAVWRMKLTYRSGTALVDVSSDDGINFS